MLCPFDAKDAKQYSFLLFNLYARSTCYVAALPCEILMSV